MKISIRKPTHRRSFKDWQKLIDKKFTKLLKVTYKYWQPWAKISWVADEEGEYCSPVRLTVVYNLYQTDKAESFKLLVDHYDSDAAILLNLFAKVESLRTRGS